MSLRKSSIANAVILVMLGLLTASCAKSTSVDGLVKTQPTKIPESLLTPPEVAVPVPTSRTQTEDGYLAYEEGYHACTGQILAIRDALELRDAIQFGE